jgi:hypothetical protein
MKWCGELIPLIVVLPRSNEDGANSGVSGEPRLPKMRDAPGRRSECAA